MDLVTPLEEEIREHFRDKLAEDEELSIRRHPDLHYLIVEFSVAWFDFLLRLVIDIQDGIVLMNRVDGPADRTRVYRQEIEYPTSIEDLLVKIEEEWDLYLGRSKRS